MPSHSQHISKVKMNLGFIDFLLKARVGYLEWVITAYFYAAVHLIEAYFDLTSGKHYDLHKTRREAVATDGRISTLFASYRQLEVYSRVARYGIRRFDSVYLRDRVVPKFERIRAEIGKLYNSLLV